MRQSTMLLRLQLKRAAKKIPQLLLGSLAISAVVVMVVLFCAYSRNEESILPKTRIAVVEGENAMLSDFIQGLLGNMQSTDAMITMEPMEREEAFAAFRRGELECVMDFPTDFMAGIGRGEDEGAMLYVKNEGVAYDLGIIVQLADSAEKYLSTAEAASYSMKDVLNKTELDDLREGYDNDLDVVNLRVLLLREDDFSKIVVVGEKDTSISQTYACSALVMLILLWGLSCGAMVKNDSMQLGRKLSVGGVSIFKQELIRLLSMIFLLGTMLALVFAALISAFPFAKGAYEQIDVYDAGRLWLLLISFIPCLLLAGSIVYFCFMAAANEIGGILLLFTGTIVMGYMSGCLLPSVYLPKAIRRTAKFLPTTYMREEAENALAGVIDAKHVLIMLMFSAAFFVLGFIIKNYRSKKI